MKILYILSGCNMGGATFSFLTLIQKIKDNGNEVAVIIPVDKYTEEFSLRLRNMGISYFIEPYLRFDCFPFFSFFRYPFKYIKELRIMIGAQKRAIENIKRIIQTFEADIIHTNVGPITAGHYAAKKTNVPHVWHIREYGDRDFKINMFPSKNYFHKMLSCDYSIFITKDLMHYNHQERNENAFVIYNGVRKESDVCMDFPKEKFFLSACRVSPEKGFNQTIYVFSEFAKLRKDYKLIILGDGDKTYIRHLKEKCINLHCDDRVVFKGYTENVTDYMRRTKGLLVASPSEGFGRMTAEAAFAGCLVVGKKKAGTKEILDETGGFTFTTDKEYLLAMLQVSDLDENEYKRLALIAQNKAVELYSEEQYIENVMNVYSRCIKVSQDS